MAFILKIPITIIILSVIVFFGFTLSAFAAVKGWIDDNMEIETEEISCRARAVSKEKGEETGHRLLAFFSAVDDREVWYRIIFETDSGELLDLYTDEEGYSSIVIDEPGILTWQGDELLEFVSEQIDMVDYSE